MKRINFLCLFVFLFLALSGCGEPAHVENIQHIDLTKAEAQDQAEKLQLSQLAKDKADSEARKAEAEAQVAANEAQKIQIAQTKEQDRRNREQREIQEANRIKQAIVDKLAEEQQAKKDLENAATRAISECAATTKVIESLGKQYAITLKLHRHWAALSKQIPDLKQKRDQTNQAIRIAESNVNSCQSDLRSCRSDHDRIRFQSALDKAQNNLARQRGYLQDSNNDIAAKERDLAETPRLFIAAFNTLIHTDGYTPKHSAHRSYNLEESATELEFVRTDIEDLKTSTKELAAIYRDDKKKENEMKQNEIPEKPPAPPASWDEQPKKLPVWTLKNGKTLKVADYAKMGDFWAVRLDDNTCWTISLADLNTVDDPTLGIIQGGDLHLVQHKDDLKSFQKALASNPQSIDGQ